MVNALWFLTTLVVTALAGDPMTSTAGPLVTTMDQSGTTLDPAAELSRQSFPALEEEPYEPDYTGRYGNKNGQQNGGSRGGGYGRPSNGNIRDVYGQQNGGGRGGYGNSFGYGGSSNGYGGGYGQQNGGYGPTWNGNRG
ncbi:hypothetical protein HDE_04894 [Halotydeus destructor]|nr:hypothetical protein HDE_04894 [Halotydeus destructor]